MQRHPPEKSSGICCQMMHYLLQLVILNHAVMRSYALIILSWHGAVLQVPREWARKHSTVRRAACSELQCPAADTSDWQPPSWAAQCPERPGRCSNSMRPW